MNRYSIQKMLGLIILYTLIIVGIFALQFRNQSIFSKNFSQMRLTLSQNKSTTEENKTFNDTFFVSFKGITLYSDEKDKPVLQKADGSKENLVFLDWKELSETSFILNFDNNISVICNLTGEENDGFSVKANIPANSKITIPYKLSKSYTITDSSSQKLTLKSSNSQNILSAPKIAENMIELSSAQNSLTYQNLKPVTQFQFASVQGNTLSSSSLYSENVRKIRNFCLNQFEQNLDYINENTVNAYMAEMTERNRYMETTTKIPASFKNSNRRTYLSAPYLNNLVTMNNSLTMQMENMNYKMNYSLEKQNLSIYETEHLSSFLLTRPFGKSLAILALPSKMTNFNPTVQQAVGIIETYTDMKNVDTSMSGLLQSVLTKCIETIEKSCSIENDMLNNTVNNERLDDISSIRIGKILSTYGKANENPSCLAAGNMLVNCRLSQNQALDIQKAASIYSILQDKNTFMPHLLTIHGGSTGSIWAWTVAQSIGYKVDEEGTVTLSVKFPQEASHYIIINGIEPFKSIEIYGMKFRTDPRFESYNSSGYVYNEKTKTLLLKCRHKSEVENIRLFYRDEVTQDIKNEIKPETKVEAKTETTTETTESDNKVETTSENAVTSSTSSSSGNTSENASVNATENTTENQNTNATESEANALKESESFPKTKKKK